MPAFLSLLVKCRITKWKSQGTKTLAVMEHEWLQGNASGLGKCEGLKKCNANGNHTSIMKTPYIYIVFHCLRSILTHSTLSASLNAPLKCTGQLLLTLSYR